MNGLISYRWFVCKRYMFFATPQAYRIYIQPEFWTGFSHKLLKHNQIKQKFK